MAAADAAAPNWRGAQVLGAIAVLWFALLIILSPSSPDAVACDTDHVPDADTVVMLSASWCGYCRRARIFLHEAEIRHCEYDIETSVEGQRRFAAQPLRVIPVLQIRSDTLVGFNPVEIRQSLLAHGLAGFDEFD